MDVDETGDSQDNEPGPSRVHTHREWPFVTRLIGMDLALQR